MSKSKAQFSIRATAVLTAATAVWLWIFRQARPVDMAVLASAALIAGLAGHLVYARWIPRRATVMTTVFLLYNAMLGTQLLLQSGGGSRWFERLAFLGDILVLPIMAIRQAAGPHDMLFLASVVLGTLIFTPAHSIRPCLPSALITSLGIAIWYGGSILMVAYAG